MRSIWPRLTWPNRLGEDVAAVFKTLVLRGDRTGHFVCVVPGDHEVDLKAAARISGNKKADLIPVRELLPTTGYIRGGCSPIGMKKTVPDLFPYFRFATLRHLCQCGSSGIADPDRSAGSASLRRGRNGRNQPSVVCGGGIRSVILFCYSIPFCGSAELSCCRSDRRTGISETIRYFSLGAGLVSPLSAGREMPYRTARIRMRITEQAAMNCVGGRRQVEIHTEIVDQSAADAGDGVDVFAENKGYFVQQHVAQHTARSTGQRTHDDTHPHRIADGYAFSECRRR